jgi:hypothetical protein
LGYLAPATNPELQQALLGGLRDLGYVEGQNLAVEYRFMLGQSKSYDEMGMTAVCRFAASAGGVRRRQWRQERGVQALRLSLLHWRPLTVERLAASMMDFAKSLAKQP